MNYEDEKRKINEAYYRKIRDTYGKYVKNFDKIPNMTQDVYIIPSGKCVGKHADIAEGKNRGKCVTKNGRIYIRDSAFCEQVLVHEFIHRLSRNKIRVNKPWKQWVEGVTVVVNKIPMFGFNEVLTEWIAFSITGIVEEQNLYQAYFNIIEKLKSHDILDKIIELYFQGKCHELQYCMYEKFGIGIKEYLSDLADIIANEF